VAVHIFHLADLYMLELSIKNMLQQGSFIGLPAFEKEG
jgi:hypothetical protein